MDRYAELKDDVYFQVTRDLHRIMKRSIVNGEKPKNTPKSLSEYAPSEESMEQVLSAARAK